MVLTRGAHNPLAKFPLALPRVIAFVSMGDNSARGLASTNTNASNVEMVRTLPPIVSNPPKNIRPMPIKLLTSPQQRMSEQASPLGQWLPQTVPTPIKVDRLAKWLVGYDRSLRYDQIISGFIFSFMINYNGESSFRNSKNLVSAYQQPDAAESKLQNELTAGRIAGPFDDPPFQNIHSSPLGVIPKKTPGEWRMIHNLSYPKGQSINDYIPEEFATVRYATADDAILMIKRLGAGCALAKADVRNAFRICPIHPSDYHLLGFRWNEQWFVDLCLPMGCASSCQLFELVSTGFEWIARHKLGIQNVLHILDGFLIIENSLAGCQNSLEVFLRCCDDIGIPMAPERTVGPSHVLTFAGIELDCLLHEARLPKEKAQKCHLTIKDFLSRKKVSLRELQSLIGLLNFACSVIVPGRVFI